MNQYSLKLFIAGNNPRSQRAVDSLRRIFDERFADNYELVVLDVLEGPASAASESILATPLLVKELPPPVRRIVGDFSDAQRVFGGLGIPE